MARIRSVHPGLFTDEAFVGLSMTGRLLIIGIWTECDDQGVFPWKPITIKMRLLPMDAVNVGDILEEIRISGMVRSFEVGGHIYGAVRNFRKFQRPEKPNALYPLPPEIAEYVCIGWKGHTGSTKSAPRFSDEISPSPSGPVNGSSPNAPRKSGQMEDGGDKMERKKEPPTPKPERQSSKAPASPPPVVPAWMPKEAWANFVEARRQAKHPLTPAAMTAMFAKLGGFRAKGHNVAEILNTSSANGWRGVFEPDPTKAAGPLFKAAVNDGAL